jgi:hypothetical protein
MIEDTSSEGSSYISSVSSSETSSERSSDIVGAPRESQSDSPDPVILKILRKIEALETRRANTHRRIDTTERLICEVESLNRIFQLQSYRLLPNNNNNDRMADERPPSVPKPKLLGRHFTRNPYADYVTPKSAPLREDSYTRTLREYADPSIQPLDDAIPFVPNFSRNPYSPESMKNALEAKAKSHPGGTRILSSANLAAFDYQNRLADQAAEAKAASAARTPWPRSPPAQIKEIEAKSKCPAPPAQNKDLNANP